MKSLNLLLDSVGKVKRFIETVSDFNGQIDLVSGRYVVDAKSLMGVFSLDLTKKLRLDVHTDSDEILARLSQKLQDFIA